MSKLVSVFALCFLFSLSALAQDKSLESAKQFFDEGQNLYLLGKYMEAGEQFTKAYEAKNFPAFLFNIAVCMEKNRDFAKALSYYEQYLKDDPISQDKELVTKRITVIRDYLNPKVSATQPSTQPSKEPAAPPNLPQVNTKGLVVIESKPEGAAIYLGDKKKGIFTRTPYTGSLPPGQHTVIIEIRKFKPERKTFFARNDRMTYLYFALSSEEYLGWIEVKANVPGADVFFDSKEVGAVGRTPYTGFLRPGKRQLIVEKPGFAPLTQSLDITAGKDHVINAKLNKVTFGWLKVTGSTTQGATVLVNGKPIPCKEHPCQTELPQGTYKVELQRIGFKKYEQEVSVANATETQLAVRLNPKPSRLKAYISWSVSGTLMAGAIAAGVMSNNRKSELRSDLDNGRIFDSSDPRIQSGKIAAMVSNSLWFLTAVTGGLGVYYFFRNEGPDSYGEARMTKIAISPMIGPRMAGFAGEVRF
jgi:hypothetical protein